MSKKIRYVPRWVAETLVIPADTTVIASPTIFANTDVWPMQLHWLSVTGKVALTNAEKGAANNAGGVARRLSWEIGMAQKGEINLVAGGTDAFFASNSYRRQSYSIFDDGVKFRFPSEYELAPDSGLVVQAASKNADYATYNPSIIVNGIRDEGHGSYDPAQLAGVHEGTLTYPASINMESSDLFNSGQNTMYLKEMLLKPGQLTVNPVGGVDEATNVSAFEPTLDRTLWRINPNNDIPWMPQDELIPVGNIAPFNRAVRDTWDEGPRAYVLPTGTKLNPRQRLTLKITNLNETTSPDGDQTIVLCMFSLLEVQ